MLQELALGGLEIKKSKEKEKEILVDIVKFYYMLKPHFKNKECEAEFGISVRK